MIYQLISRRMGEFRVPLIAPRLAQLVSVVAPVLALAS